MAVTWTSRARKDLEEIYRFIARDDPAAAGRWIARLVARAETAAKVPRAGRIVPELQRDHIREFIERKYRIVYRVGGLDVTILTVFEGHRLLRPAELTTEEP